MVLVQTTTIVQAVGKGRVEADSRSKTEEGPAYGRAFRI